MGKVNKKDTTPEQEERAKTAFEVFLSKESLHFTPGSFVLMNNRRGRVLTDGTGRVGKGKGLTYLLILWEDGSLGSVVPFALNR